VKANAARPALDPSAFSGHGLRAGFLTSAGRPRGFPVQDDGRDPTQRVSGHAGGRAVPPRVRRCPGVALGPVCHAQRQTPAGLCWRCYVHLCANYKTTPRKFVPSTKSHLSNTPHDSEPTYGLINSMICPICSPLRPQLPGQIGSPVIARVEQDALVGQRSCEDEHDAIL
jgi:hypothetical protein